MESVLPICRVCLNATNDSIDLQTPFQSKEIPQGNTTALNYLECLRLCTNLAIEDLDNGPQCLCTGCESELQIVYKFLQKAQSSQSILEENWQKYDHNKDTIEHMEISIEKIAETAGASGDDFEQLINAKDEALDVNDLKVITEMEEFTIASGDDFEQLINAKDEALDVNDLKVITEMEEFTIASGDDFEQLINAKDEALDVNDFKVITEMEEFTIDDLKSDNSDGVQHLQEDSKLLYSKKLKCHICNRTYRTSYLLKVHLNYHKRRNVHEYTCKVCDKSFALQRYLTQHMKVHEDFQETHKCEYCEKEYISKTALISHKRIHQGQPLHCSACGKQFSGSYELKVHLRFHRREKELENNQCEICRKGFSSQRYLTQHMVVHFDNRATHKCNYCNKVYISTTALNNHKRLHERQTLDCAECGKQFSRSYELKIHMRFHRREKEVENNQCEICSKEFSSQRYLTQHMVVHFDNRATHKCNYCNKVYISTTALNNHKGKCHSRVNFVTKHIPPDKSTKYI